jgi:hypothetical protein
MGIMILVTLDYVHYVMTELYGYSQDKELKWENGFNFLLLLNQNRRRCMMRRKVIQLAPGPGEYEGVSIYALCDDGTIWCYDGVDGWELFPDVPQRELTEEEAKDA